MRDSEPSAVDRKHLMDAKGRERCFGAFFVCTMVKPGDWLLAFLNYIVVIEAFETGT